MAGPDRHRHDGVLVLGAGLAGLSAALACAPRRALVVTASPLGQGCASAWAQGGVAAALSPDDAPALHARDTVAAGAGLVEPAVALRLAEAAPETIRRLAELGAPFDRDASGAFVQSLEAAHSRPRVARVGGDRAGREVMAAVEAAVLAAPHVEVRPGRALALLRDAAGRVRGALVEHAGARLEILADAVILATGGLGGLYAVTTNPAALRGEGMALAALAGAQIADPEFVQFHPTALDAGLDPAPLLTEALRGEGAVLVDARGEAFMAGLHPQADLAPRDIVARAVHARRASGPVYLDAVRAVGAAFPEAFPAVFEACRAAGLDPRVEPIPVAPAAHYHMGGVAADACGRTSLPGLYAVGECASTGVHGANRLASNSLLEAAAFGHAAGLAARDERAPAGPVASARPAPELPCEALAELRQAMSRWAGVVRDGPGLGAALDLIDRLEARHGRALALVSARLVVEAALARTESRGGHFRSDFPATHARAGRTLVTLADLASPHLTFAAE